MKIDRPTSSAKQEKPISPEQLKCKSYSQASRAQIES